MVIQVLYILLRQLAEQIDHLSRMTDIERGSRPEDSLPGASGDLPDDRKPSTQILLWEGVGGQWHWRVSAILKFKGNRQVLTQFGSSDGFAEAHKESAACMVHLLKLRDPNKK